MVAMALLEGGLSLLSLTPTPMLSLTLTPMLSLTPTPMVSLTSTRMRTCQKIIQWKLSESIFEKSIARFENMEHGCISRLERIRFGFLRCFSIVFSVHALPIAWPSIAQAVRRETSVTLLLPRHLALVPPNHFQEKIRRTLRCVALRSVASCSVEHYVASSNIT